MSDSEKRVTKNNCDQKLMDVARHHHIGLFWTSPQFDHIDCTTFDVTAAHTAELLPAGCQRMTLISNHDRYKGQGNITEKDLLIEQEPKNQCIEVWHAKNVQSFITFTIGVKLQNGGGGRRGC